MSKHVLAIMAIPAAIAFADSFQSTPATVTPTVAEIAPREDALRVKLDLARGVRWELRWDSLAAYDLASGAAIREIRLPGATLAGARDSSAPDMVLGRSGAVYVSSNIEPRLWRISPARFEVEVLDIVLESDHDKDFGFEGLAWETNERILRGVSAPGGVAWRIDLRDARAARLPGPLPQEVAHR